MWEIFMPHPVFYVVHYLDNKVISISNIFLRYSDNNIQFNYQ